MILAAIIVVPLAGGLLGWLVARRSETLCRWIALVSAAAILVLGLAAWKCPCEFRCDWIPQIGASLHLAADGLSLVMILLTGFLGALAIAASWTEIRERVGAFHLNVCLVLAGVTGVFLAADLFLFFFFWELMLVPMFFLIDQWGHEKRHAAAVKFFLFTQLGGLLMLVAILGLYFVHARETGRYTFDTAELMCTPMSRTVATWLMLGFFAAFAVKLPVVPLHTWLPDAHTEAPTAGSVLLAGLLLKTGAYGMLRFVIPLFPGPAREFAPFFMILGIVGILYGAVMAFAQTDLKRLIAYTSVSHLGFVMLGAFSLTPAGLQGAALQMVCHGISTGALFILVGALQDRIGTRDLNEMGGLQAVVPRMAGAMLFFALASLGLPGLGNFIAEVLALLGAYQVSVAIAAVAAVGLVAATVYSLWLVYRAFHGPMQREWTMSDLGAREMAILLVMAAALLALGLYPQPTMDALGAALDAIARSAAGGAA